MFTNSFHDKINQIDNSISSVCSNNNFDNISTEERFTHWKEIMHDYKEHNKYITKLYKESRKIYDKC